MSQIERTRPGLWQRSGNSDLIAVVVIAAVAAALFFLFPGNLALLTRIIAIMLLVLALDLVTGFAGVATLGAAGVEVAQNVLAETQSAILPLVPYLDTLRWVFIAVALAGIAVAIYARIDDWKRGRR